MEHWISFLSFFIDILFHSFFFFFFNSYVEMLMMFWIAIVNSTDGFCFLMFVKCALCYVYFLFLGLSHFISLMLFIFCCLNVNALLSWTLERFGWTPVSFLSCFICENWALIYSILLGRVQSWQQNYVLILNSFWLSGYYVLTFMPLLYYQNFGGVCWGFLWILFFHHLFP